MNLSRENINTEIIKFVDEDKGKRNDKLLGFIFKEFKSDPKELLSKLKIFFYNRKDELQAGEENINDEFIYSSILNLILEIYEVKAENLFEALESDCLPLYWSINRCFLNIENSEIVSKILSKIYKLIQINEEEFLQKLDSIDFSKIKSSKSKKIFENELFHHSPEVVTLGDNSDIFLRHLIYCLNSAVTKNSFADINQYCLFLNLLNYLDGKYFKSMKKIIKKSISFVKNNQQIELCYLKPMLLIHKLSTLFNIFCNDAPCESIKLFCKIVDGLEITRLLKDRVDITLFYRECGKLKSLESFFKTLISFENSIENLESLKDSFNENVELRVQELNLLIEKRTTKKFKYSNDPKKQVVSSNTDGKVSQPQKKNIFKKQNLKKKDKKPSDQKNEQTNLKKNCSLEKEKVVKKMTKKSVKIEFSDSQEETPQAEQGKKFQKRTKMDKTKSSKEIDLNDRTKRKKISEKEEIEVIPIPSKESKKQKKSFKLVSEDEFKKGKSFINKKKGNEFMSERKNGDKRKDKKDFRSKKFGDGKSEDLRRKKFGDGRSEDFKENLNGKREGFVGKKRFNQHIAKEKAGKSESFFNKKAGSKRDERILSKKKTEAKQRNRSK